MELFAIVLLYAAAILVWGIPLTTYLVPKNRPNPGWGLKDRKWYRRTRIGLIVTTVYVVLGSAWHLYCGTFAAAVPVYVFVVSGCASTYTTMRLLVHFFDEAPMQASYRKM